MTNLYISRLLSATAICTFLWTNIASAENRPEWSDGKNTFVFLKDIGPVDRIAADAACTSRGLKPLTSKANCGTGSFYILECIAKLGDSYEPFTTALKSSPLWAMLPAIQRPDDLAPEVLENVKGVWYHPDYSFKSAEYGNLLIRFYALQPLDVPNSPATTEFGNYETMLSAQEKLSVICLK
jgi:hypothetical protein